MLVVNAAVLPPRIGQHVALAALRRDREHGESLPRLPRMVPPFQIPDRPQAMLSLAWIAIRCEDMSHVLGTIGLQNQERCNWSYGRQLTAKYGSAVFVTPPINGWVFVLGRLPFEASTCAENDPFLAFLKKLSHDLGEVHWFSEDNSCPWCEWALCREGQVIRAYAFRTDPDCTILWNEGKTTDEERKLGLLYGDRPLKGEVLHVEYQQWLPPEGTTQRLASLWGLSPNSLTEEMALEPSLGVTGEIEWRTNEGTMDQEQEDLQSEEWTTPDFGNAAMRLEANSELVTAVSQAMEKLGSGASIEELELAEREIGQLLSTVDPLHCLEIYCEEKGLEFPESLKERSINNMGELAESFEKLLAIQMPALPREAIRLMAGTIAGMSLKAYEGRLRPRSS